MLKTIKVMLVITVAISMVEVAYFISEMFSSRNLDYSTYEFDILRRSLVYWFSGAISTVASFILWKKERILSVAVGSGGVYLMALGANGGLWTEQMICFRLVLAVLNVAYFLLILRRVSKENEPNENH
jgi:hypothetical protein